jgi:glycerophosphoryl diester phosphodiesterase
VNLRQTDGRPLAIGHRGAKADAPENSLAGLEAAVAAGVDLVEFDIAPGLVVAHDPGVAGPSLDDALELLKPAPVGLHLDVKQPGYEQAVLEAVDRHGLRDRVLVSTAFPAVSRRVAALAPGLPIAIGYPRDRADIARFAWPDGLVRPGRAALRAVMPARIPLLLRQARANVLALHWQLCSPAAIAAAHRAGAPVFAWTVNEAPAMLELAARGVDGIVSDDPKTLLATLRRP